MYTYMYMYIHTSSNIASGCVGNAAGARPSPTRAWSQVFGPKSGPMGPLR